jgi:hypothetical protein
VGAHLTGTQIRGPSSSPEGTEKQIHLQGPLPGSLFWEERTGILRQAPDHGGIEVATWALPESVGCIDGHARSGWAQSHQAVENSTDQEFQMAVTVSHFQTIGGSHGIQPLLNIILRFNLFYSPLIQFCSLAVAGMRGLPETFSAFLWHCPRLPGVSTSQPGGALAGLCCNCQRQRRTTSNWAYSAAQGKSASLPFCSADLRCQDYQPGRSGCSVPSGCILLGADIVPSDQLGHGIFSWVRSRKGRVMGCHWIVSLRKFENSLRLWP